MNSFEILKTVHVLLRFFRLFLIKSVNFYNKFSKLHFTTLWFNLLSFIIHMHYKTRMMINNCT